MSKYLVRVGRWFSLTLFVGGFGLMVFGYGVMVYQLATEDGLPPHDVGNLPSQFVDPEELASSIAEYERNNGVVLCSEDVVHEDFCKYSPNRKD